MQGSNPEFEWLVIGAGPAGIAAVGKLIDAGVSPHRIGWMDPDFQVGDFGKKWNRVPSNTKNALFLRFLNESKSFAFQSRPSPFEIETLDPNGHCPLQSVVEPLQWITERLKRQVRAIEDFALGLNLAGKRWEVKTKRNVYFAKKVILAIGSEPKTLSHSGFETLSLETALNEEKLAEAVKPSDRIAVFGSSHSAVLVLANLTRCKVEKIVQFHRSPHRYAIPMQDWILFDDTGLKGFAAEWAKEHLDGTLPPSLKRVSLSHPSFEEALSLCNKGIYAVGFERRKAPLLEQYKNPHYDDKTGIIAPGLLGSGSPTRTLCRAW